jgi:histidine ammonia-lyase
LTLCTATLAYELLLLLIDRFTMKIHILDGVQLTIPEVFDLANKTAHAKLSSTAKQKILRARKLVEQWSNKGEVVYGVTTGFGEFANVQVKGKDIEQLQENLIFSHAAGAGDPLPAEVVRAMMALRVNALAKGFSGIRLSTVELLLEMLNRDIVPVIPSQGSVGASGDLVQLAHLVLAMMGKGKINQKENGKGTTYRLVDSSAVLRKNG